MATGNNLSGTGYRQALDELDLKEGCRGMLDVILQGAQADALTLREAGRRYGHTRMNPLLVGTPTMIADHLARPSAGDDIVAVLAAAGTAFLLHVARANPADTLTGAGTAFVATVTLGMAASGFLAS